jgi:hypothetical protein
VTEDYDPADDRYINNPNYEPEFDPEGDTRPGIDPAYEESIRRYVERCNRWERHDSR